MAAKKSKSKKSPITKKTSPPPPPSPPYRQQWPFSDHPRAYKLWDKVTHRNSALAITKSWLPPPTTTRCDARHNQPPQLRHVAAGPPQNHTPHPHNRYLRDITKATSETPGASQYWCILRHSPAALLPNPAPALRPDPLGPKLQLSGVSVGPGRPRSGLVVSYGALHASGSDVYWLRGVAVWHECVTPDPFDPKKKPMEFTSMVRFRGNFYAMSLQGALAVMQVVETRLTITGVTVGRAVPRSSWRFFKEYLCEMNGEILLVFLIHMKSLAIVDDVEVFRLDLVRMDWVKFERLQGKAMFLNQNCSWVNSEELWCKDDRVYFTEGSENIWKVYNMKTCSISLVPAGWSWNPLVGP
ncbi:uncharacterized protein LOC125196854 [Salvia hispanica]|uniref:uncharacterized protein LOC125196854 n=1 Tax=Salvia hispanica TaxID=49212 RepID=UPI002009B17C|nr:uncharacterized protein LOC125196854 [Salvia hispanica]